MTYKKNRGLHLFPAPEARCNRNKTTTRFAPQGPSRRLIFGLTLKGVADSESDSSSCRLDGVPSLAHWNSATTLAISMRDFPVTTRGASHVRAYSTRDGPECAGSSDAANTFGMSTCTRFVSGSSVTEMVGNGVRKASRRSDPAVSITRASHTCSRGATWSSSKHRSSLDSIVQWSVRLRKRDAALDGAGPKTSMGLCVVPMAMMRRLTKRSTTGLRPDEGPGRRGR